MLLFILSLAGLSAVVSSRSVDPVILLIARDLSVPVAIAAMLATAYSLPFAMGQPVLGPMGDIYGKARVMKSCLWVLAASLAICAVAPSIEILFTFRVISGIAAGGVIPSAMATMGDRFPGDRRQIVISRFVMVSLLGQVFSASLAGVIAVATGWRSIFVIAAAVALTAAVTSSLVIREVPRQERARYSIAGAVGKYRSVFANPKAILCFSAVFLEGMTLFGVLPYVAELLELNGVGSTREAGFVIGGIGAGGVLYTLVLPLLTRWLSRGVMIALGGILATSGLWGLGVGLHWPVVITLFAATGFGYMMLHNSIQTEVVGLTTDARASAYSMHAFSFFSGQAVGPVLFGLGLHTIGAGPTIILAGLALATTGCVIAHLFVRLGRRRRSGS